MCGVGCKVLCFENIKVQVTSKSSCKDKVLKERSRGIVFQVKGPRHGRGTVEGEFCEMF